MDIIDKLEKAKEDKEKVQQEYFKNLQDIKTIIKNKFNNKDGFFVMKFLKRYLFSNENNDLNPQMLAFEKGKRFVYNQLLSLLDEEIIINYINSK